MFANTSTTRERVCADVGLLAATFMLPSLLALIVSALLVFRYRSFYEFPVVALLVDVLYRPQGFTMIGLFGVALSFVFIVDVLRAKVRPKDKRVLM